MDYGTNVTREEYWKCADGTRLRYSWFRLPADNVRGTVLCLHGRKECIEIYLEQIAELNARGFDVVTFDWRGQGGSDRPLADRHKQHVLTFTTYSRDLQNFYASVVKPEQRGKLITDVTQPPAKNSRHQLKRKD